jgi:undecaprenyl-diphosphatase
MLLVSIGCLVFAFAFAEVGSRVLQGDHKGLDQVVRDWFQSWQSPAGERVFNWITWFGHRLVLLPVAVLLGWPLFRRHLEWLVILLFCAIASAELSSILKHGFEMPRPPLGDSIKDSFAFPSGHTIATATVSAVLGYLALRRRIAPFAYIAGGVVITLLVGASRIYLDMHWFSDVIGGILVGSTFATGVCALYEWLMLAFTSVRKRRAAALRPEG